MYFHRIDDVKALRGHLLALVPCSCTSFLSTRLSVLLLHFDNALLSFHFATHFATFDFEVAAITARALRTAFCILQMQAARCGLDHQLSIR
jgi:hypothetical protein